ncbi:N-hydroxyarylamine O-acetyltransferase [Pseudoalteromonas peptidolytica F12-50-A1]|uniref:N-hydroxyarylamine O-acetyltransferase n=2 Tax=Pseudoalteromonas peptidolytica TaxID=61150 RepID=A0A8I0T7G8_9GAMM|nr:N-hydroxyarylamine O-acetyltransferase [Pseudoalteromonas peptidolytica F12-50-A1]NLR15464.1 arylamine N-acetyltransferase [Pseudoalteromonas peptidolytica]GEK08594.1 N-hydroxyarylamine O-acetyltransferase [Pseudoalteromonas peptidolytica]
MELAMNIKNYLDSLSLEQGSGLALVTELQQKHLDRYAFSSINAMYGERLLLDEDALFNRLITQKQGGYCFEQNKIAYLALQQLGFTVRPVLARVMLNGQQDNPRSHRMTLLELEGEEYLVDVGFGVKSPQAPININQALSIQGRQTYQVQKSSDYVKVTLLEEGEAPLTLYHVDLGEIFESDCEIGHFFSHQHPDAGFVNNLIVSRVSHCHRYLIRNQSYFEWHECDGNVVEQPIESFAQLEKLVREQFSLTVPSEVLKQVYDKVLTRAANKPTNT